MTNQSPQFWHEPHTVIGVVFGGYGVAVGRSSRFTSAFSVTREESGS